VNHTALQVHFSDGESVVLDWHNTLDPYDPKIQQVNTWLGK